MSVHEYEGHNPRGAFDPQPGRAAIYQPVGQAPRLAKVHAVDRPRNTADVTFPDSDRPARVVNVRLEHLRRP